MLANHFISQLCQEHGILEKPISKEGIKELQKIKWTGNIREFKNVIERLLILSDKSITDKEVIAYARPLSN